MCKCKKLLILLCLLPIVSFGGTIGKFNDGVYYKISDKQEACALMHLTHSSNIPLLILNLFNSTGNDINVKGVTDLRINDVLVDHQSMGNGIMKGGTHAIGGTYSEDVIRRDAAKYNIHHIMKIELCGINNEATPPTTLLASFGAVYPINPPLPKNK